MVQIQTVAGVKSPVETSAQILATLRQRAEDALGDELVGAVITVPAYFDDAQRQATKDAAHLAALNVLRLLNEPTAAAIPTVSISLRRRIFAVFDLGGGTFDISILKISEVVFEVLAVGGDSALGGDDFDHAVGPSPRSGTRPIETVDDRPELVRQLMIERPRSQGTLLGGARSTISAVAPPFGKNVRADDQCRNVRGDHPPFVQRSPTASLSNPLRDAKDAGTQVNGVVLVGGATRMPVIRRAVESSSTSLRSINLDPDKVVALGAAIQANPLAGNRAPRRRLAAARRDSASLGVETMGGLVEKLIPRNSTIPVARAQEFTTFNDGQTALAMHVVQGERELVGLPFAGALRAARHSRRWPPAPRASASPSRSTPTACCRCRRANWPSGVEAAVAVKPSYGLVRRADHPNALSPLRSNMPTKTYMCGRCSRPGSTASRLLEAVGAALAEDAELLDDSERAELDALLDRICATSRKATTPTRSKPRPKRSPKAPTNSPPAA